VGPLPPPLTAGIGLAAAHQLAALEPELLILACRNVKTGDAALASVLKQSPSLNAAVWELDLASFASVKAFAGRANELDRLDVAILNWVRQVSRALTSA
jgi:NAD(P)-dependent dehydrogenase (short-subunit alcohol dehydrogenase family)